MHVQNYNGSAKNKTLVIAGPTATGKTALALHLAEVFNGELVSADSRQIYRGMDIGTGKDLPLDSKLKIDKSIKSIPPIGYHQINGIKVWGYDLVSPREDFSVAHYLNFAHLIIEKIKRRKKLPILVGGTGFYIKSVLEGVDTAKVPINKNLRNTLENFSSSALYEKLAKLDPIKAASLNRSEKNNPRRLIRSIEVANWDLSVGREGDNFKKENLVTSPPTSSLFVGLTAPKEYLYQRVEKRVLERVEKGVENEIAKLLKSGISWDNQSMDTIGYKEWRDYFENKKTKEEVVRLWMQNEKKYLKRQLTWFKNNKSILWFDISKKSYVVHVENVVKKWYKKIS